MELMIQKNKLATKPESQTENENKTREKNGIGTRFMSDRGIGRR